MEQLWTIISDRFTLGLGLGLLLVIFLLKSGFSARGNLKREIARMQKEHDELQGHLNTQLKINASGNEKVRSELEKLREQNENLRVNLAQLQQKPGRVEMRQLHIIETAASRMRERAPGFAPAWEQALREAEDEAKQAEGGLKKLVRRVIPSIGMGTAADGNERRATAEKDA